MTARETSPTTTTLRTGDLIYRVEARLADLFPIGLFREGIRFHNDFSGTIVEGPFAGGRFFGLDQFLLRHDGVGEIVAPEVIEAGDVRATVMVRGYVVPPAGFEMPPLEVLTEPGFEFPDLDFRVTASGIIQTAHPAYETLNRTVAVIEGRVNMGTGALSVEARAA